MKTFVALMMMSAVFAFTQAVALPSGWIRSITIETISDSDIDGEVVQITVSEVVDNPAHCADSTGYAIRDPNTVRGSLALLMSAFVTGKQEKTWPVCVSNQPRLLCKRLLFFFAPYLQPILNMRSFLRNICPFLIRLLLTRIQPV